MSMRADGFLETTTATIEGRPSTVTPLGLTLAERGELEWYWGQYEAEIGIKSNFREMVDVVADAREPEGDGPVPRSSGGGGGDVHSHGDRLLALHFQGRTFRRADAVYRALKDMPGHHLTVLWLLYGPSRPSAPHAVFGDVAPVVHLTDAAAAIRELLATNEGYARYDSVSAGYSASLEEQRLRIAHDFWDAAGEWQRLEARIAQRLDNPRMQNAKSVAMTDDLQRRTDAWRTVMRTLLRAHAYDGLASAQATACASADLEITPQGAVRWVLEYHGPRLPDGKADPEAMKAHNEARKAFERTARRDAERLRIAASIAYRQARRGIGAP